MSRAARSSAVGEAPELTVHRYQGEACFAGLQNGVASLSSATDGLSF
jgi:hypothetical protein